MIFTVILAGIIGLIASATALYYLKKFQHEGRFRGLLNKTVVDIIVAIIIAQAIIIYFVGTIVAVVTMIFTGNGNITIR